MDSIFGFPIDYSEGTEGLFDFFKKNKDKSDTSSLFSKKKEVIKVNMTKDKFIKEATSFFSNKQKELQKEFAKYPNAVKKYYIEVFLDKYNPEKNVNHIGIRCDFSKGLNFIDDNSDPDRGASLLLGTNSDGIATFTEKVRKEFNDKFGIKLDEDGDTDCVFLTTPFIYDMEFTDLNKESGTESEMHKINLFNI